MKNNLSFGLLFVILVACNVPLSDQSAFNQSLATRVSIAQTSTAISSILQTATAVIGNPPNTPVASQPTSTSTPAPDNPKDELGSPAWKDTLDNGNYWSLSSSGTISNDTLIKTEGGSLVMSRNIASGGKTWWLTYPRPKNFYLEGVFSVDNCSGTDQYGLVFRAVNYNDGFAYYFIVRCDGNFSLMKWDGNGASNLFNWEKSENIQTGSGKSNGLGVWCNGNSIRLYINSKLIKEIVDNSLTESGYFGLFMDARETPGFTIRLNEVTYWDLP